MRRPRSREFCVRSQRGSSKKKTRDDEPGRSTWLLGEERWMMPVRARISTSCCLYDSNVGFQASGRYWSILNTDSTVCQLEAERREDRTYELRFQWAQDCRRATKGCR